MTRTYSRDSETTEYLGYRIVVQENHLAVYTRTGFLIVAGRISMQTARNVIRQHRGLEEASC